MPGAYPEVDMRIHQVRSLNAGLEDGKFGKKYDSDRYCAPGMYHSGYETGRASSSRIDLPLKTVSMPSKEPLSLKVPLKDIKLY